MNGQVELEINSSADKYYLLQVRHHPDSAFKVTASITMGESGSTLISEPLGSYPANHYQVLEFDQNAPGDFDNDGINDLDEYNNIPSQGPLNSGLEIDTLNGQVVVDSYPTFNILSVKQETVQFTPYLDGKEFTKFIIFNFYSTHPQVYFINTNTHALHADFANYMGEDHLAPETIKGQVVFHPTVLANNGSIGTYAFNYSNGESKDFEIVQRTQELLAANMPYLTNNLSYFVNVGNEADYNNDIALYDDSRIPILLESDVYGSVDYWGLNQKEGYGFFRQIGPNEVPGSKDIVLYDALPNTLPRVGGIMTSVFQTPLSHVNLRAIQDKIPNAFIRDPLDIDSIADLLDHYVYYNVEQSSYTIREATIDEVNAWYEALRPTEVQAPPLNLDYTSIKSLDSITFTMYDGFGAKAANVATMRTFGFDDGTIPYGYGVPFYYYFEFMQYNGFFDEIAAIIADPLFQADRDVRDEKLEEFRERIEDADMPLWMLDRLAEMHASFPVGTSVRCRSSTNNEDLPGFSGAGLYDSKTQHPSEGHISKSIKQIYASLWNLRAFEERDFYRVDHFLTAMGVLCHPNYADELVNGVGVSSDPIYQTENTFYWNTQLASELITNPTGNERAEELLVKRYPTGSSDDYAVLQYSSLLNHDSLLMTSAQRGQLRTYLGVIHDEFERLYHAEGNPTFAMDIEYKITSDNRLAIKQARPWVSFRGEHPTENNAEDCELLIYPNPAEDFINVQYDFCSLTSVQITDYTGRAVIFKEATHDLSSNFHIYVADLSPGMYVVTGYVGDTASGSKKFMVR
ncbi:MAG: hypothetical protein Crog4KO_28670 [Crocinitomicaceae bacterium]